MRPPSLSWPSLQAVSSLVAQSSPSQPGAHSQRQAPWKLVRHWPLLLHILGQPSSVQCRPFQPVTQRQVPFLHWPCCSHLNISKSVTSPPVDSSLSLTWHHSLCSDTDCLTSSPDRHTCTAEVNISGDILLPVRAHLMFSQWPCWPHSSSHCSTLQSAPVQPWSHMQV